MGNTVRVIARLDIKGPNLIKGIQFEGNRCLGTADGFGKLYYEEGADELVYQDAVASLYRRNSLHEIIRTTAETAAIPLTVVGGMRSTEDIREVLRAGADKVAINTAGIANPQLFRDAAKIFGSQCIVASIEVYRGPDGTFNAWTDYGRQVTGVDAIEWAQRVEDLGAGEILLTSINNDGVGSGFDVDLVEKVSAIVSVPVIAGGGAGKKQDFVDVVLQGGADAVAAASIFHYHYCRPVERPTMSFAKNELRMGVDVDSGNVEFLNGGYGGVRDLMVDPCSISEVKTHMQQCGIETRPS